VALAAEGQVMLGLIDAQLPWWVTGPGVGLCVVALYGLINARLGVSGAWLATIAPVEGWRPEPWRRGFLLALVGGSLVAAVLGPPVTLHGYGRLSELLPPVALVPVLLLAGAALGYGARWAGGCTSGHGMSGCAAGSPDSFATTGTFFSVAVLVTLALNALTGGAL
jgi:xanthine/uracil permease